MIDLSRREKRFGDRPVCFVDPDELNEPALGVTDLHTRCVEKAFEPVAHWMNELRAQERRLLELKYWENATQAEIARSRNLTEARVSQLHSNLIKDARNHLAA